MSVAGDANPSPRGEKRLSSLFRNATAELAGFRFSAKPGPEAGGQISSSVRGVMDDLGKGPMAATAFFARLCEQHPDYIGRKAGELAKGLRGRAESDGAQRLTADQWVEQARPLFRAGAVSWLNTRYMMLALALLDADLFQVLLSQECFAPLFDEIAGRRRAEPQVA